MMEVRRYSWRDLSLHALPPMLLLDLLPGGIASRDAACIQGCCTHFLSLERITWHDSAGKTAHVLPQGRWHIFTPDRMLCLR